MVAASQALFGRGELAGLDGATLAASLAELPQAEVDVAADGWPLVVDLLVATGLATSKSAARRAVAEGGAYLNNARVAGRGRRGWPPTDLLARGVAGAPRGKRTLAAVRVRGRRRLSDRPVRCPQRADLRICVSGRGLSNVLHVARQGETDTGSVAVPGVAPSVTIRRGPRSWR